MRVPTKVHGLLFSVTCAEVDGPIEPHSNERSDMRATISPYSHDPEKLGGFKEVTRFIPSRRDSVWVAEARVDGRDWFVHQKNSFRLSIESGLI